MTRNREPQSNPACDAAIIFEGHKRFEDMLLLFEINARACIRHPEMNLRQRDLRAQCNLSVLGIFFGIAQQIQKYLTQAQSVCADLRQALWNIYFPLNVWGYGLICKAVECIH